MGAVSIENTAEVLSTPKCTCWLYSRGYTCASMPFWSTKFNSFKGAEVVGGIAGSSLPEIFLNTPTTAHCMGGCGMGKSAEHGVVDGSNRVYGYKNMLICDGSMLGANLGVNPSLTITALTEHAMSLIPTNDTCQ